MNGACGRLDCAAGETSSGGRYRDLRIFYRRPVSIEQVSYSTSIRYYPALAVTVPRRRWIRSIMDQEEVRKAARVLSSPLCVSGYTVESERELAGTHTEGMSKNQLQDYAGCDNWRQQDIKVGDAQHGRSPGRSSSFHVAVGGWGNCRVSLGLVCRIIVSYVEMGSNELGAGLFEVKDHVTMESNNL